MPAEIPGKIQVIVNPRAGGGQGQTTARVESAAPLDLYEDGEFIGQRPFTLRIRPRSLEVMVP